MLSHAYHRWSPRLCCFTLGLAWVWNCTNEIKFIYIFLFFMYCIYFKFSTGPLKSWDHPLIFYFFFVFFSTLAFSFFKNHFLFPARLSEWCAAVINVSVCSECVPHNVRSSYQSVRASLWIIWGRMLSDKWLLLPSRIGTLGPKSSAEILSETEPGSERN